ncbi:MAG: hypothetical protein U0Y68_24065, partial [Blastocatellia bacterium]
MKLLRQHPLTLLLIGALLHSPLVRAQSIDALTLPLAVEIALKTTPLVKATATGREMADARWLEARASRWPIVQVS